MLYIIKITDEEKSLLILPAPAQEYNHTLILIAAVNPLKAIRVIIHLIQGRVLTIQLIKHLYIILHILVDRFFQQLPLQGGALIPLVHLGVFLAHEQQLLSWMAHHEGICGPQVLRLLFQGSARHFSNHGTLAVYHLIM